MREFFFLSKKFRGWRGVQRSLVSILPGCCFSCLTTTISCDRKTNSNCQCAWHRPSGTHSAILLAIPFVHPLYHGKQSVVNPPAPLHTTSRGSQEVVGRTHPRPREREGSRGNLPRGVLGAAQGGPQEGSPRGPGVRECFSGRRQEDLEDGKRERETYKREKGG